MMFDARIVFRPHATLGRLPEESVGRCHGQPADAHQEQLHARRAQSAGMGTFPSSFKHIKVDVLLYRSMGFHTAKAFNKHSQRLTHTQTRNT